jgi:hypothetical protein
MHDRKPGTGPNSAICNLISEMPYLPLPYSLRNTVCNRVEDCVRHSDADCVIYPDANYERNRDRNRVRNCVANCARNRFLNRDTNRVRNSALQSDRKSDTNSDRHSVVDSDHY